MYIVVFNIGFRRTEFLTDNHGFITEFSSAESADKAAREWIDSKDYLCYKVFKEQEVL
mgnify:CR=1 FL=1